MDRRDRQNLSAALVVLCLLIAGLWLMSELRRNAAIEDCMMARRRDCASAAER